MDWSYYCSCHGKGGCDGEGGTVKNAADKFEFGGDASGKRVTAKIQGLEEFVDWCRHGHGSGECLAFPKRDLVTKLHSGTGGIFRRFFHIVPVKGPMAVNRRIPAMATLTQSNRFHSVVDIGHPLM
eukprot:3822699-Pleurochrysis_carterae.AAC.1